MVRPFNVIFQTARPVCVVDGNPLDISHALRRGVAPQRLREVRAVTAAMPSVLGQRLGGKLGERRALSFWAGVGKIAGDTDIL